MKTGGLHPLSPPFSVRVSPVFRSPKVPTYRTNAFSFLCPCFILPAGLAKRTILRTPFLLRYSRVEQKPSPRVAEETSGDAPPGDSEPCSPKKRLESAVETDRVLTNALCHMEAGGTVVGGAGVAAEGGVGGGGPAPAGDEAAS